MSARSDATEWLALRWGLGLIAVGLLAVATLLSDAVLRWTSLPLIVCQVLPLHALPDTRPRWRTWADRLRIASAIGLSVAIGSQLVTSTSVDGRLLGAAAGVLLVVAGLDLTELRRAVPGRGWTAFVWVALVSSYLQSGQFLRFDEAAIVALVLVALAGEIVRLLEIEREDEDDEMLRLRAGEVATYVLAVVVVTTIGVSLAAWLTAVTVGLGLGCAATVVLLRRGAT